MQIKPTHLADCFVIEPRIFHDPRGFFYESFNKAKFEELTGINTPFIQDNLAYSTQGVVRGLHFQKKEYAQAKLVTCLQGKIIDVAVDIRKNSLTYGQSFAIELNDQNRFQLYIPRGFAHGYSVLSKTALVMYKVDNQYNPQAESGLRYDDPQLNINWQIKNALVSDKDLILPTLATSTDLM